MRVRCSQCKKDKPLDEYPARLINLKPYQVCTAHAWYWTAAKQHSQWAPSTRTSFEDMCSEVSRAGSSAQGKWLVEAGAEDRQWFVEQLAAAGNWTAEELCVHLLLRSRHYKRSPTDSRALPPCSAIRPTTAKGDAAPSPTWVYSLWPSSTSTTPAPSVQELFKLQLWHHEAARAFTITLRSDGASKGPAPWARPGRVRPSQAQQAQNAVLAAPAPAQGQALPARAAALPVPPLGSTAPPRPQKVGGRFATSAPSTVAARNADRDRDREQMPPPPVPSARPAKKARRVEPQLVSPTPTSLGSSGLITPFSAAHAEWSHFLSFPTLVQQPQQPVAPPAQQQQQHAHHDFPLDPLLLSSLVQPSPSSASLQQAPVQDFRPLSLAELLSSAIFEPPIIDLPPRPPPTHHTHARAPAHAPAPRSGRALDAAVADALGATPDTLGGDESASGSDEDGSDDDAGRGYYEDSIPDESSADDDDAEEGAGEGQDGASVSSFFESSAEETEYGSDDERALSEDEDDEGEDNWLEGFAAQQMGLGPRRGVVRGRASAAEELEEEEDEGADELSEGEGRAAPPARPARASGPAERRGAQQGRAAVGVEQDEDEVDELDSPSSG